MLTTQPVMQQQQQGDGSKPPTCQYISICDKPLGYCRKIRRDLEFHNDQWHFLKAMLLWLAIVVGIAIFCGLEGLHEFHFPTVYDRHEVRNAIWLHILYLVGALIAAGVISTIMLESHSCFLKTTLCNLNVELRNSGAIKQDLTVTNERNTLELQGRKSANLQYFSVGTQV